MKYKYSSTDYSNLKWFENDMSRASLSAIKLRKGTIRGLNSFEIRFRYPISVIAGANGSGKSTILALAACAYHNRKDGFKLPERKFPYYTMSDYFVQSSDEIPPEGINIWYAFLYDRWRKSRNVPTGVGLGWQSRTKRKGGKWSNYSRRVNRNVVFFGIERVVPHSERSISKSYRSYFTKREEMGYEKDVCQVVSRILGTRYDQFWFASHSKYRLAHVVVHGRVYSGFNMGAGENALFEIFSTIFACPHEVLLVIDEIELGLHEKAQRKLIYELKELCKERHMQVICTTHSGAVVDSVPPEARFFVERQGEHTVITEGISSAFAAGRLAGRSSDELDLYVEDGVAQKLVQTILPLNSRRRVNLIPIGSASSIVHQMAARFRGKKACECLAIMDGDQRMSLKIHKKNFLKALETDTEKTEKLSWLEKRLIFLPGDKWPEHWILSKLLSGNVQKLAQSLNTSQEELKSLCEDALLAGKHRELITLARNLALPIEEISSIITRWNAEKCCDDFLEINSAITVLLN